MDRFLFRVWDNDNKHYFTHLRKFFFYGEDVHVFDPNYVSPVKPDQTRVVLEQCVGIRDKNGRPIFEGDIVIMDADCMCADQQQVGKPCRVEFGGMGFWFVYPQLDNEHKSAGWNECAEYEVIGNIHQNPELLEEGDGSANGEDS